MSESEIRNRRGRSPASRLRWRNCNRATPLLASQAAQDLLDLAAQSLENMVNVSGYLTNDVIRRPEQVSADTWRDAALILGRLRDSLTTQLTLYLERDGAATALIELGEPAVQAVSDVLQVGGPSRRLIAAEMLGAIGSPTARDALTVALKTESDASVRQGIQTALSRFGQRPPSVEVR